MGIISLMGVITQEGVAHLLKLALSITRRDRYHIDESKIHHIYIQRTSLAGRAGQASWADQADRAGQGL